MLYCSIFKEHLLRNNFKILSTTFVLRNKNAVKSSSEYYGIYDYHILSFNLTYVRNIYNKHLEIVKLFH